MPDGNMDNNDQGNKLPGDGQGEQKPASQSYKYFVFFLIILFLIPVIANMFMADQDQDQIAYSRFRQEVKNGNVLEVTVQDDRIEGTFRPQDDAPEQSFVTYVPSFGDTDLLQLLEEQNVQVRTEPAQDFNLFTVILNILPLFIFIWIGIILFRSMRQQGRNIFSINQNKAKLYKKTKESTTFDDVAGASGPKEEIQEIVDYLKHPEKYQNLDARTPKGVLLLGPPGTGKTLIARAIAGEADVPFYSMSGSDFMEMFVGVGAARVRKLFEEAKRNAPSIIFVDELDSVGRHRGAGLGGGHDEREQTLNQLLSELDGFEQNDSTIIIAATNRPDILDPALLRPGRFDRRITVGLPSLNDRVEILKVHARKKPLAPDVDMQAVARGCPGFSGADLQNLLNEAALLAARERKAVIEHRHINQARDKILMGLERRNLQITDEERKIIAYHEAGHAVLAAVLPHTDPLHKVTIIPRDFSMGVTQQLPEHEKYVYSREYLNDRLVVTLGGRAAEDLVIHSVSSGAENDFHESTKLARRMVSAWGMSEKIGPLSVAAERQNVFLGEQIGHQREHSDETAREVDLEVQSLLLASYERAKNTLQQYRDALEAVAQALLDREELSGKEVLECAGLPPKDEEAAAQGAAVADQSQQPQHHASGAGSDGSPSEPDVSGTDEGEAGRRP